MPDAVAATDASSAAPSQAICPLCDAAVGDDGHSAFSIPRLAASHPVLAMLEGRQVHEDCLLDWPQRDAFVLLYNRATVAQPWRLWLEPDGTLSWRGRVGSEWTGNTPLERRSADLLCWLLPDSGEWAGLRPPAHRLMLRPGRDWRLDGDEALADLAWQHRHSPARICCWMGFARIGLGFYHLPRGDAADIAALILANLHSSLHQPGSVFWVPQPPRDLPLAQQSDWCW